MKCVLNFLTHGAPLHARESSVIIELYKEGDPLWGRPYIVKFDKLFPLREIMRIMSNTSFQCFKTYTLGHWPLDVDSTIIIILLLCEFVILVNVFFSPQEEKPGIVDITKTDALISW